MKRMRHDNGANEEIEVEEGCLKREIPKSRGSVKLGDLIWVKLHPSSWWPAQVVDADTVSQLIKPSERSVGEVLVRVYGSYLHLYVDPLESRTEFDKVFKLYNGNYDQILKESLNKDRPHSSKSKGRVVSEATQSVGEVSPEICFDASPEEGSITQGRKDNDLSWKRLCDNVSKHKGGKKCGGMNDKNGKKNIMVMETESSLQRRVSPRRKLSSNKLETTHMNGGLTSEVGSATRAKESYPPKEKFKSKTNDNENTGSHSKISTHPDGSERSKRIMQSLALVAPCGSPFNLKIRHN